MFVSRSEDFSPDYNSDFDREKRQIKKEEDVRGKLVIFLVVCFVVSLANVAHAAPISFGDNSKYWPGWGNGSSDDSQDTIGNPDLTGGSAEVTGGILTGLTINRALQAGGSYSFLSPGDLFIDLGANQTWDYVVDLTSWGISSPGNPDPGAGNYNLIAVNLAMGSPSGYILSGADYTGPWSSYAIRDSHPVAAVLGGGSGDLVGFSGWGSGSTTQYTFDLSGLPAGGLNLGTSGQFNISWTQNCANDVMLETIGYTPIPEPATLSLLGLGLLGLVGFRKKKS
ncbi:PEP-CTERM sorting domain-containing protein [Candidatus Omnitrophota bacterium]